MKKMKYIKMVGICFMVGAVLSLTGCKGTERVRVVVERMYEVSQQANVVVDVVRSQLIGSELWEEHGEYILSLEKAIDAIIETLERIAPYVKANLSAIEVAVVEYDASSPPTVDALNSAIQRLLESIDDI